MIPDETKINAFLERVKRDTKAAERGDIGNTLVMAAIAAALAYWAYGTVAHSVLFAFVVFAISAVGNRVTSDLRRHRAQDEGRSLVDDHFDQKRG